MALIKKCKNNKPKIHSTVFLADNASVIGDVIIGENSSIWFNAVVRGDVNSITIGKNVNIQDGAVIHCTYQKTKTVIGDNTSIGHNAIVHGCEIAGDALIGMGAIIMDNCHIQKNVVIAAGSVMLEGTKTEEGFLYAGTPAKKIKPLTVEQIQKLVSDTPKNYIKYSKWFDQ